MLHFQCLHHLQTNTATNAFQQAEKLFKEQLLPCAAIKTIKEECIVMQVQRLTAGQFSIWLYQVMLTEELVLKTEITQQDFYFTYFLKMPGAVQFSPGISIKENECHLICLQPGTYQWKLTKGMLTVLQIGISRKQLPLLYKDVPGLAGSIASMLKARNNILSPYPARITSSARQCIEQVIRCRFKQPAASVYLNLKMKELVFDFAYSLQASASYGNAEKEELALLSSIETYIGLHLHKPVTSQVIMQHFHISEYRLKKIFKLKHTSPALFIAQLRMEKALALLKHTSNKITAIGREVGYRNPSWFADAFFKYHGIKPSEVRSNTPEPGIHSPDPGMKKQK